MFIGELAAAAGVSVQAVRLYERRGLIPRARRSEAGYRVYDRLDLDILLALRKCQHLGLTLAETRTVLALFALPGAKGAPPPHAGDEHQCLKAIEEIGLRHLAQTDARIERLVATRAELAEALDQIRQSLAASAEQEPRRSRAGQA